MPYISESAANKDMWAFYIFYGSYIEYATLHIPESLVDSYKETAPWCYFGSIVGIPEENTGIGKIENEENVIFERYTIEGQRATSNKRGLQILKMNDGKTKKIFVR